MKKKYISPQICFDDFAVSANIAACELMGSNSAKYFCPVLDPELGYTIYDKSNGGTCASEPQDGESLCYGVPAEDYNVYMS